MKEIEIRCIFPKTFVLLERLDEYMADIEKKRLMKKVERITKFCTNTSKFRCIINDLSKKKFYIDRSISDFNDNLSKFKDSVNKRGLPKQITYELINCFFFFESFLYQSKAFLDVLVKFYGELVKAKYQFKYRSFNAFRKSIINNTNAPNLPQHIANYFKTKTDWFKPLKEYRDMIAHMQSYNPAISKSKDGNISLDMCTVYRHNPEETFFYGGDISKSIDQTYHGIEDLIKVIDDFLSKYLLDLLPSTFKKRLKFHEVAFGRYCYFEEF